MRYLTCLFLLSTVFISSCSLFGSDEEKIYPEAFDFERVSFEEFRSTAPLPGSYNVEGYIARITECPPCPDGAICAPCQYPDGFLLSKNENYVPSQGYMDSLSIHVQAKNPEQFQGKKGLHVVSVDAEGKRVEGGPLYDVKLRGYEPAE